RARALQIGVLRGYDPEAAFAALWIPDDQVQLLQNPYAAACQFGPVGMVTIARERLPELRTLGGFRPGEAPEHLSQRTPQPQLVVDHAKGEAALPLAPGRVDEGSLPCRAPRRKRRQVREG